MRAANDRPYGRSLLIIEHAVAEAVIIRVRDLIPEFLAHALIFLRALSTAGAVAPGTLQAVPDGLDHFLVFI